MRLHQYKNIIKEIYVNLNNYEVYMHYNKIKRNEANE